MFSAELIRIELINVVSLHPQFHTRGVYASSAGAANIFRRRLLAVPKSSSTYYGRKNHQWY